VNPARRLAIILLGLYAAGAVAVAEPTVVIPERFKDSPVIVENSSAFNALVNQNKKLRKQLQAEQKDAKDFEASVAKALRDMDAELQSLRAENAKLKAQITPWYKRIPFFNILSIVVGFISNPLSFIVTRLIELGLGILAIAVFVLVVRKVDKHFRKK
jgi:hypothetical protein